MKKSCNPHGLNKKNLKYDDKLNPHGLNEIFLKYIKDLHKLVGLE